MNLDPISICKNPNSNRKYSTLEDIEVLEPKNITQYPSISSKENKINRENPCTTILSEQITKTKKDFEIISEEKQKMLYPGIYRFKGAKIRVTSPILGETAKGNQ